MHEIISIQIGSQSNHVGTHFWNAQESYFTFAGHGEPVVEHDVHWQQGKGADGADTFAPRTLIYDFKSAFGSLRRVNELYRPSNEREGLSFEGSVLIPSSGNLGDPLIVRRTSSITDPPIPPHQYQTALDNGYDEFCLDTSNVRYWSDYNRVFYHPKSLVQIYEHDVHHEDRDFKAWETGESLFTSMQTEDDLVDRDVRAFAENCDQMQGFQFFLSVDDGWSGFAARYLELLNDEYQRKSIMAWALSKPIEQPSAAVRRARTLNQTLAVYQIANNVDLFVPVAASAEAPIPPWMKYDAGSAWHVAAMQLAGIETITLPSRLKSTASNESATLDEMSTSINPTNDKTIAALDFEVGGATPHSNRCHLFHPRSQVPGRAHVFAQFEVDRGATDTVMTHVNGYAGQAAEPEVEIRMRSALEFPLPSSYPRIFNAVERNAWSLPLNARLISSSSLGRWVRGLKESARYHMASEDREEICHQLEQLSRNYMGDGLDDDDDSVDDE